MMFVYMLPDYLTIQGFVSQDDNRQIREHYKCLNPLLLDTCWASCLATWPPHWDTYGPAEFEVKMMFSDVLDVCAACFSQMCWMCVLRCAGCAGIR